MYYYWSMSNNNITDTTTVTEATLPHWLLVILTLKECIILQCSVSTFSQIWCDALTAAVAVCPDEKMLCELHISDETLLHENAFMLEIHFFMRHYL